MRKKLKKRKSRKSWKQIYDNFSALHFDQMSEGSQISKFAIFVKILNWQSLSDSLTRVKYRAARAAKNIAVRKII